MTVVRMYVFVGIAKLSLLGADVASAHDHAAVLVDHLVRGYLNRLNISKQHDFVEIILKYYAPTIVQWAVSNNCLPRPRYFGSSELKVSIELFNDATKRDQIMQKAFMYRIMKEAKGYKAIEWEEDRIMFHTSTPVRKLLEIWGKEFESDLNNDRYEDLWQAWDKDEKKALVIRKNVLAMADREKLRREDLVTLFFLFYLDQRSDICRSLKGDLATL